MRRALVLAILSLTSGCSGALADGDGRAFGDDLGRFHIVANLDSTTCGPQAMDAPEKWEFDVVLSQEPPTLYWNTGADAVEGTLDSSGRRFSFSSETVVSAGAAGSAQSGAATDVPAAPRASSCTIVRGDAASGTFDVAKSPHAFKGELTYSFKPAGASDCSEVLLEAGLATLPCSMTYRMDAERTGSR